MATNTPSSPADRLSSAAEALLQTIVGTAKIILAGGGSKLPRTQRPEHPIVVMGNGPSLADTIRDHSPSLRCFDAMAVNFAANTREFFTLKPRYYILIDPHFFARPAHANVATLWENLAKVDWPMTLIVPRSQRHVKAPNSHITLATISATGMEGFKWARHAAYSRGLAMPRPRNVLIPAIMAAIFMGYKNIYIVGADHSWMRTIDVDADNRVVSVQPHFYKEKADEQRRVDSVYAGIPLHSVVHSFYVAFHAYHLIADYARAHGITIINSTPQSFIDAFPRSPLPEP